MKQPAPFFDQSKYHMPKAQPFYLAALFGWPMPLPLFKG